MGEMTIREYAAEAMRTSQLDKKPELVQEMLRYVEAIRNAIEEASNNVSDAQDAALCKADDALDDLEALAEHLEQFIRRTYSAFALAGEVGEFVDMVKKDLYHDKPVDKSAVATELGDVAWGLAYSIAAEGLDHENVHRGNVSKLRARYPEGYSHERANAPRELKFSESKRQVVLDATRDEDGKFTVKP